MRLPILNTLPKRIELHSLFLQPTYWCAKKCEGCYVKEREPVSREDHANPRLTTSPKEQFELIKLFCEGEAAWANEITIAMDDIPSTKTPNSRFKREHMTDLYDLLFQMIHDFKLENKALPKMHMTFHSVKTYLSYIKDARFCKDNYMFKESILDVFMNRHLKSVLARPAYLLDMINFSQLTNTNSTKELLKEIRKLTPVNYNYLIPRNVNNLNIKKHVKHLIEIAPMVDHIYLVIHKTPVGKKLNSDEIENTRKNMANDLFYIEKMKESLPAHIWNKIDIDGCLQDVKKFKNTGYGCSGNISKMQIWPDGKVTGCSYKNDDPEYQSSGATTSEHLVWHIKNAKTKYDFEDAPCHLPDAYDNSEEHIKHLKFNRFHSLTQEIL